MLRLNRIIALICCSYLCMGFIKGTSQQVKTRGIELHTQTFGDAKKPSILLIMGATASMTWWDDEFCRLLADKGYFVIRYDNRDTGESTHYAMGNPPYSIEDLAKDSIAILDHYGVKKAHFVGMSLGGMISQITAMMFPERVQSLTLIASSLWTNNPELPGISKKILHHQATAKNIDWSKQDEVLPFMIEGWRLLTGEKRTFDRKRAQQFALQDFKRTKSLASMFNHAQLKGAEEYYDKYDSITQPTLIIHGTDDPILPFQHAEYTHAKIKNSKLIKLDGAGHEINRQDWLIIINELILNFSTQIDKQTTSRSQPACGADLKFN